MDSLQDVLQSIERLRDKHRGGMPSPPSRAVVVPIETKKKSKSPLELLRERRTAPLPSFTLAPFMDAEIKVVKRRKKLEGAMRGAWQTAVGGLLATQCDLVSFTGGILRVRVKDHGTKFLLDRALAGGGEKIFTSLMPGTVNRIQVKVDTTAELPGSVPTKPNAKDKKTKAHPDYPDTYDACSIGTRLVPADCWESPAEREFAQDLGRWLKSDVEMRPGNNVSTPIGLFRPDIILVRPGKNPGDRPRTLGLEVDGRKFHTDQDHDYLRDCGLLAGRFVDAIYRFMASTTLYRVEDCVYILSRYEPGFFDQKALEVSLPTLASDRVRAIESFARDEIDLFGPLPDNDRFDGDEQPRFEPSYFKMKRRALDCPKPVQTIEWFERELIDNGPMPYRTLLDRYKVMMSRVATA